MKRIVISILTIMLFATGCSLPSAVSNLFQDPEELLQKAFENMQSVQTIRTDGESKIEGNLLGSSFLYQMNNESQSKLENGMTTEAYMKTTISGTGIPSTTEETYFSDTEFGTYDQHSNTWLYNQFNAEDQFIMDLYISLFDPANSINQYYDSKVERELDIIGNQMIGSVPCIGITVTMNADQMTKELSPIFSTLVGPAGSLATSLTGAIVKNMEITYWIGEEDHLVHGVDTLLPTPFGNYTNSLIVYDHNAEFHKP